MNLLLQALLSAVETAARGRDLKSYRVAWKHNEKGEMVVAIITSDARLARERLEPRPNGYRPPR